MGLLNTIIEKLVGDLVPAVGDRIKKAVLEARPLKKADADAFSIAVGHFENDKDAKAEGLIVDALVHFQLDGMEVFRLGRTIPTAGPTLTAGSKPTEGIKAGHALARKYLNESGCDAIIWGRVLDNERLTTRLYWTAQNSSVEAGPLERFNESVPSELFWEHLASILALELLWQLLASLSRREFLTSEQLGSLIKKSRELISGDFTHQHWDAAQQIMLRLAFADVLTRYGYQYSSRGALEEAIVISRQTIATLQNEKSASEWAHAHETLGGALGTLGELTKDLVPLEEAAAVERAALTTLSPAGEPDAWATAQHNLGLALARLGDFSRNQVHLNGALDAFNAVLSVRTAAAMPIKWAVTKEKMGTTLMALDAIGNTGSHLDQAITAFREALMHLNREEAPEDWARTLNNLGAALYMKGHQSGSTEILSQAAQIFRSALSTWPRTLMPMEWARANHNLGLAILAIEEINPSLANVLLASGAFARALEIKPWVEMKISQHQLQVAQQRLDQRRAEAVDYAYGLRDQARMTLRDLNYLLLSGKRQEWLARVKNLLGEAEQFFEIYGDDKARSFVHALSANPAQWMARQREVIAQLIGQYEAVIALHQKSRSQAKVQQKR